MGWLQEAYTKSKEEVEANKSAEEKEELLEAVKKESSNAI